MEENKKTEELPEKRGRGRPKGSGGNKRPDRKEIMSVYSKPGDNARYLKHSLNMWDWQKPDMTNVKEVSERIKNYMQLCINDDVKPSVEGLALAFCVDRRTFWKWSVGQDSKFMPDEVRDTIKKAYQILNAQFVNYAQDGKMDRSVAIFLMKNNFGYKDQQEVTLSTAVQEERPATMEELESKYSEAIDADFKELE